MPVITITIVESSRQIVSGIPQNVTLESSVPATIFFTLDGSDPDMNSEIAVGPIAIPTNKSSAILKILATDGVDSSGIITQIYSPDITSIRNFWDKVTNTGGTSKDIFPFGSPTSGPNFTYGNVAVPPVDSLEIVGIPDGYDGTGTGTHSNETDRELSSYEIVFSETNFKGERGHGIGTLPAQIYIRPPNHPDQQLQSSLSERLFNPRAMVILQDATKSSENDDIIHINRQHFSLADTENVKAGALLNTSGEDSLGATGTFLKSYYNPKENTMTYYYFDSATLRWIISKEPFTPKKPAINNFGKIVFSSRGTHSNKVFKWMPFKRSRLI